jgi:hypothetical protein
MKKSQLMAVIIIMGIITTMFMVYSTETIVNAAITTPSVDTNPNSRQSLKSPNPSSLTITTSLPNEIIYASLYSQDSSRDLSISSSPSLTWHYRGGGNAPGSNDGKITVWWAVSATTQTVTITFSASGSTGGSIMTAFCVKDANPVSPFDPNLGSAKFGYGKSASASVSISTTNQNDLIIGILGLATNKAISPDGSYTQIVNTGGTSPSGAAEYREVPTMGPYTPSFTIGNDISAWVEIADAFTGNTTLTVLPEYSFGGITACVVCLAAMLVFFNRKKAAQKL